MDPVARQILEEQIVRNKREKRKAGYEPAFNAYFDFYLGDKYLTTTLLKIEDVTFHLYLRKNFNPNWEMPSIRQMKRKLGVSHDKIGAMIGRLTKAHLLKKISGVRDGQDNCRNDYLISDPITDINDFLLVAQAGLFPYPLHEEWVRKVRKPQVKTSEQQRRADYVPQEYSEIIIH